VTVKPLPLARLAAPATLETLIFESALQVSEAALVAAKVSVTGPAAARLWTPNGIAVLALGGVTRALGALNTAEAFAGTD
jgi:hypothetical protein